MDYRVAIQWTDTAKKGLAKLPPKVRRGLLQKADELLKCGDPRLVHKPLSGPLSGYYRIVYSRYRAVFRVDKGKQTRGKKVLQLIILFVTAGIRKVHDKKDLYRLAEKLVDLFLSDEKSQHSENE